VLVVHGAGPRESAGDVEVDVLLRALLAELPVSQAAKIAARISGRPRKDLYDRALALGTPRG
jgi:16S rRNA (cytidine1402-2'-O)-methyltransferase